MSDTHYDVLDVSPDASNEAIRQAYQQKVDEYDSDGDETTATERLMRLRAAKETLLDPQARTRYDRSHNIRSGGANSTAHADGRIWVSAPSVSDVVDSPTVIRLAGTGLLSLVVVWTFRASVSTGWAVLVSLCVCYVGYGVLTPLPFEEPRARSSFTPAHTRIWPVLALHLLGLGLLVAGMGTGAPNGGLGYALMAVLYALIVSVGCLVLGFVLAVAWKLLHKRHASFRVALALGLIVSIVVLFTSAGKGSTLSAFIGTTTVHATPWVSTLRAGPVYLGSLLNFSLAVVMLVGLVVGIVGAVWALTVVPWRDRYDHGYRIHPTTWNLLAVVPLLTAAWLWLNGVQKVVIPVGTTTYVVVGPLEQWLVVLPSLLVGAYLLRRRLEPLLQQ